MRHSSASRQTALRSADFRRAPIWRDCWRRRTFLWHTLTDATVPVENTLLLEAALRRENISHELHLFPHGVHGLALADLETADPMKGRVPDRHINRWQALCAEWLKEE